MFFKKKPPFSNFAKPAVVFFSDRIKKYKKGFYGIWSYAALAAATSVLDIWFFPEAYGLSVSKDHNPFFQNRDKLTNDIYMRLCKTLVGCFLYRYMLDTAGACEVSIGLQGRKVFESKVFDIFAFEIDDIPTYRNWNAASDNEPLENFKLYGVLIIGLGLDLSKYRDPDAALIFSRFVETTFGQFISGIDEEINKGWPIAKHGERPPGSIEFYTNELIQASSMTPLAARRVVVEILDFAVQESKNAGTFFLSNHFGDILLGNAESKDVSDQKLAAYVLKAYLPRVSAEGITDDDIRFWWNRNDIDRREAQLLDNFFVNNHLNVLVQTGKTPAEAKAIISKGMPQYGDCFDPDVAANEDSPLPFELRRRIDLWIQREAGGNINKLQEKFKNELRQFSTLNAFIRKQIRAGNL